MYRTHMAYNSRQTEVCPFAVQKIHIVYIKALALLIPSEDRRPFVLF